MSPIEARRTGLQLGLILGRLILVGVISLGDSETILEPVPAFYFPILNLNADGPAKNASIDVGVCGDGAHGAHKDRLVARGKAVVSGPAGDV